jgi:hypothetical protein
LEEVAESISVCEDEMSAARSVDPNSLESTESDGKPFVFDGVAQTVKWFAEREVGYDIKGGEFYRTNDQSKCGV